jgi:hypothetical protein
MRDELEPLLGQKVLVTAIRDKVSYNVEKMSSPKVLITDIQIHGANLKFDHVWINYSKQVKQVPPNALFAFRVTVKSILVWIKMENMFISMVLEMQMQRW